MDVGDWDVARDQRVAYLKEMLLQAKLINVDRSLRKIILRFKEKRRAVAVIQQEALKWITNLSFRRRHPVLRRSDRKMIVQNVDVAFLTYNCSNLVPNHKDSVREMKRSLPVEWTAG